MLEVVESTIYSQPNRARNAMNRFVIAVGVSFIPLHEEAMHTAERIGAVSVSLAKGACSLPNAFESIKSEMEKGRLGFKRKNVRC